MVSTLRASAPKAKAKPLDHARAMKGDPRDPRADPKTWPCMGRHVPGPPAANNFGQWQHCARCDYRMSYIPRRGAKGQFTATKNPEMVARALRELRPLMGDFTPTATIVRAMQAKVDAEEVLRIHIHDLQANYTDLPEYQNQLETAPPTKTRRTHRGRQHQHQQAAGKWRQPPRTTRTTWQAATRPWINSYNSDADHCGNYQTHESGTRQQSDECDHPHGFDDLLTTGWSPSW